MVEDKAKKKNGAQIEAVKPILDFVGSAIAILVALGAVGALIWAIYEESATQTRGEKTVAAHLKSRYGATPIGTLYWGGKTWLGGGTETTMIRFDDSKIQHCVVTGNSYDDPILVCNGNEPRRIG